MKHISIFTLLVLIAVLIAACGSADTPDPQGTVSEAVLVISGGDVSKSYTRADLETFTSTQATFKGVTYKGVTVSTLLQDAGFDLAEIKAIKGVASDGYSVNYDTSQVLVDNVIVAYATADGELTEEDGSFRMVLPDAEGKLNIRMLVELQVVY